jgi:hypothetical protein
MPELDMFEALRTDGYRRSWPGCCDVALFRSSGCGNELIAFDVGFGVYAFREQSNVAEDNRNQIARFQVEFAQPGT